MTHIYIFNENARAAAYGIGTYIRQLTEFLKNGKDVYLTIVNLSCSEREEFAIEEDNGIRNIYCPGNIPPSQKLLDKYYRNVWYLLCPHIQYNNGDRLIFHLNYSQEYPLLDKMKQDFPFCHTLFTIHYQEWGFLLKGNESYFKQIIHKRNTEIKDANEKKIMESYEREKKLYSLVDKIICLSDYTKTLLKSEYQVPEHKIIRIYNGLKDEAIILSETDKRVLKQDLGFYEKEKVILFAGRLDDMKGADILIKAFNRIVLKCPECRLVIAGDGNMTTKYMKEIKGCWGKVSFTGRLEKIDLYKLYQIADLGVMPSMNEQCSYVAIEMMMFGIPVIATTTTGLNEMIQDGKNGRKIAVVENNESVEIPIENLEDEIYKLIDAKVNINDIRAIFSEKYELEQMEHNYMNLYMHENFCL